MGLSEIPPPPEITPGFDLPELRVRPPGPQSRTWLTRYVRHQAPMGPPRSQSSKVVAADVPEGTIVLAQAKGCNVIDVDSNRYVDFAAGFGSLLLGHNHASVLRALELQGPRLMQGLGDVYPSDAKIGLLERLARLHPAGDAQVILGQSGADAVTAALKTAVLARKKTGILAFGSAYHGLSYGALSVTDLRPGYRAPFADHLAKDVTWVPYPSDADSAARSLQLAEEALKRGTIGAVIVEPILGRGGVIVPPEGFLGDLSALTHQHAALLISDEIWTGLGRAGAWLAGSTDPRFAPDLICIGKGLGGGIPISACLGSREVMAHWQQSPEVVHTSTFAGAPLACTAALATLDVLGRQKWIEKADVGGNAWIAQLKKLLTGTAVSEVRGRGYMIGLDCQKLKGGASALQRALLERGFITSTGGGNRDVLVLTPPLIVSSDLLMAFEDSLRVAIMMLSGR
jgi:4-aminobutyrate aminotransferase / (S)-3-amino-2-methylpropionate transaminase / 5-aminovalerate transaminase